MKRFRITYKGEVYEVDVEEIVAESPGREAVPAAVHAAPPPVFFEESRAPLEVRSPMSGRIIKFFVGVGDVIKRDEPVAVLEAMKMENLILADKSGTISKIAVKINQLVETDEVIAVIE